MWKIAETEESPLNAGEAVMEKALYYATITMYARMLHMEWFYSIIVVACPPHRLDRVRKNWSQLVVSQGKQLKELSLSAGTRAIANHYGLRTCNSTRCWCKGSGLSMEITHHCWREHPCISITRDYLVVCITTHNYIPRFGICLVYP